MKLEMSDYAYLSVSGGRFAKVDLDVYVWASEHRWHLSGGRGKFYVAKRGHGARKDRLHRLIVDPPPGMVVDHINGDPLDNRRVNLRVCTQADNLANRGVNRTNGTGIKGVRLAFPGRRKPYIAQAKIGGVMRHLGCFETADAASRAYDAVKKSA